MRWRSRSMSSTLTLTVWPISSTSDGWLTWLHESSEMWMRPSMPSRSTKAPKSTMFEIVPSTTSPGLSRSRIACRISLRSSSRTARRQSTTLLRERLSSITLQRSSLPRNSSRSWTRRMSTSDAGRKPRTPRSRIRPPLTTSITLPITGSPALGGALDPLPRQLEARALLGEDQPALGVLLRHDERVDLLADRDLVGRVHRAADRELGDRDDALRLVADVDEHLVLVDAHDGAVHDLALVDRGEGRVVVGDELPVVVGRPDAFFEPFVRFLHGVVRHGRTRSIARSYVSLLRRTSAPGVPRRPRFRGRRDTRACEQC